jgi:hypothetical protein
VTGKLVDKTWKVTAYRATPWQDGTATLLTNAIEITDLDISFQIDKSDGEEPNKCELVIFNVAPKTRAEIVRKPLHVNIEAGYDGERRLLFVGDLRYGYSVPVGTQWETRLELADGDRAYGLGRVNRSYKTGTNIRTAIEYAAKQMGFTLPRKLYIDSELSEQFQAGSTLSGSAAHALTKLLAPYGYHWSIQNNTLQVLSDDEVRESEAWVISEDAGMEGSPEWQTSDKAGESPKLRVSSRLFPQLIPGGKVRVDSRDVRGLFRIKRVSHSGESNGQQWSTEIEVKPL